MLMRSDEVNLFFGCVGLCTNRPLQIAIDSFDEATGAERLLVVVVVVVP